MSWKNNVSKKQVCMFVWNHFTNDARVLRECTALADAGYEVDLVCIHDWKQPNLPRFEERQSGFTVTRVSNRLPSPLGHVLALLRSAKRIIMRNIITMLIAAVAVLIVLLRFPLPALILLLATLLLSHRKTGTFFNRAHIAIQMVLQGMKKSYDMYHSNDLNTLPQGIVCAKLLRRRKLIYDSHEVQTSRTGYDSRIYGIMERLYLHFVDVIIAENHTRAAYNEKLYGIYPKVIHNYPFVSRPEMMTAVNLHKLLDLPEEERILLYQGGIQKGRGLDKIIEAVPMMEKGTVVLIGDGRIKPDLVQMVQERGLEGRVKFLDKVPVEQLLQYTRNAYLGFQVLNNINFNHYSASSNKLFEYMMSGVPVVACSFPEIQKVVEGENVGLCVDSHDPASIADGVNHLLNHPDRHAIMKDNCFKAREKYNWEQEKLLFLSIYNELKQK